jgi:hypothetical protein
LRIGNIQSGTYFFTGALDDVRLYNYVLGTSEVAALAGNTAPHLPPIANRSIVAGTLLSITNVATDNESPPQILTYSLTGPPPPALGAAINSSNGIFLWRPLISQANTTNFFNVQVTDDGTPPLSASSSFSIVVNRPTQPGLSDVAVTSNQFKMLVNGDAGPNYSVLASTDLVNWVPLFITNSPALPFLFTDPSATNFNWRFYRVILGP